MPSPELIYILRADSTREQEWFVSLVMAKDIPVELFSASTHTLAFRIEEEERSHIIIKRCEEEVIIRLYAEGFDDG